MPSLRYVTCKDIRNFHLVSSIDREGEKKGSSQLQCRASIRFNSDLDLVPNVLAMCYTMPLSILIWRSLIVVVAFNIYELLPPLVLDTMVESVTLLSVHAAWKCILWYSRLRSIPGKGLARSLSLLFRPIVSPSMPNSHPSKYRPRLHDFVPDLGRFKIYFQ